MQLQIWCCEVYTFMSVKYGAVRQAAAHWALMEVFCWLQCVRALVNDWFPRPGGHFEHDVHGSRLRGTTWTEGDSDNNNYGDCLNCSIPLQFLTCRLSAPHPHRSSPPAIPVLQVIPTVAPHRQQPFSISCSSYRQLAHITHCAGVPRLCSRDHELLIIVCFSPHRSSSLQMQRGI